MTFVNFVLIAYFKFYERPWFLTYFHKLVLFCKILSNLKIDVKSQDHKILYFIRVLFVKILTV